MASAYRWIASTERIGDGLCNDQLITKVSCFAFILQFIMFALQLMQHDVFMQHHWVNTVNWQIDKVNHVHNTLQTLYYFGEKHHGGWGLLNVKRGVGLFTHYFMLWLFWRETQWGLGASQCEMRGRALHALFLSFAYPYNNCSYRHGFTNVKSYITIVILILRS